MEKRYNLNFIESTRLFNYSLVLFFCVMAACQTRSTDTIALVWKNNRATGIRIPNHLIDDMVKYPITVSLNGSDHAILGNFNQNDESVLFEPLIPLSPGMEYGVIQNNRVVGKIAVPLNTGKPPQVSGIYPQVDTVPENLLKFYIQFSEPMQTGKALEHIFLLDNNRDTLYRLFLDLQPELWDTSGKVLTLWIDPGRIKRDLVLNKELGNPLHKSQAYELVVTSDWKDHRGLSLEKSFSKKFVAGPRTDTRPDINQWQIAAPKAGTTNPLIIYLGNPFDHYLLQESVEVFTANGKIVKGDFTSANSDQTLVFKPAAQWQPGKYKLRVQARLEDLAGNNLNKVFDRDIYKQEKTDNVYYERGFEVK